MNMLKEVWYPKKIDAFPTSKEHCIYFPYWFFMTKISVLNRNPRRHFQYASQDKISTSISMFWRFSLLKHNSYDIKYLMVELNFWYIKGSLNFAPMNGPQPKGNHHYQDEDMQCMKFQKEPPLPCLSHASSSAKKDMQCMKFQKKPPVPRLSHASWASISTRSSSIEESWNAFCLPPAFNTELEFRNPNLE